MFFIRRVGNWARRFVSFLRKSGRQIFTSTCLLKIRKRLNAPKFPSCDKMYCKHLTNLNRDYKCVDFNQCKTFCLIQNKQNEREKYTILIFGNVLKLIFNKQKHG